MAANPETPDTEDEVEASRAPLLDHLVELRKRLIITAAALFVAFVGVFVVSERLFEFLIIPYVEARIRYEEIGAAAAANLIFTGPLEFFIVKLKLSMLGALAVGFPVLAWQIYAFVAPGLYKKERGALLPFLLAMPVLFVGGAALVYYAVLPLVMHFSLSQQFAGEGYAVELLLRVDDYFKLVTALILAFGAAFQLPVVLTLLGKAGIVSSRGLRKAWKYAVVLIFTVAMFVTPPDIISQTVLAIPVLILYELSILAVKAVERQRAREDEEYAEKLKKEDAAHRARQRAKKEAKAAEKAPKPPSEPAAPES